MSSVSMNQAAQGRYLGINVSGYAGTFSILVQSDGIYVLQNGSIIKGMVWDQLIALMAWYVVPPSVDFETVYTDESYNTMLRVGA